MFTKNKQPKEYEISMDCTVDFGVTILANSLEEAGVIADRIQEQLQEQLTVDCGRLNYTDDIYVHVYSIRKKAIYH